MIGPAPRAKPHDRPRAAGGLAGVARGGLASLAGAGFAGVAGLAVTWLVARALGPDSAGVFFAAVAGFTLATGLARLGTPTGLVYWVARLRALGRPELLGACLRAGLTPVAIAATALAIAVLVTAPWLSHALTGEAGHAGVLRTLALFLPAAALGEAALAATRGWRLLRPTVTVDKLVRPAGQLIGVGVLSLLAVTVPLTAWALAWVLPYALVLLLAGYVTIRCAGTGWPRDPGLTGAFWRFTGPRAVASGLQLALQRLDILLVAALAGPAAAAVYTVAGRFVVLGQLANQAIGQAVQPRLAERLSLADRAGAALLYRTATGWLILITWPLYLLVICYAPLYLGLFGSGYRDGRVVVVVLAAAMLVSTGCGMVDMLLTMGGRTGWNLLNVALALAAMSIVDVLLIPRLGATGAALGFATAVAVNNLLPLAQIGYALRLHPFGTGTVTAAGLAVTCFGALPTLAARLFGTGPVPVAVTLLVSGSLYLAGAHRFRHRLALPNRSRGERAGE